MLYLFEWVVGSTECKLSAHAGYFEEILDAQLAVRHVGSVCPHFGIAATRCSDWSARSQVRVQFGGYLLTLSCKR
jgi:hypothetical protein